MVHISRPLLVRLGLLFTINIIIGRLSSLNAVDQINLIFSAFLIALFAVKADRPMVLPRV